jgi:dihydroorotate dehydrogenase
LTFPNPVGLAAGFDKAAELISVLPHFGFGFMELGTFTPLVQEGQQKPRLFRYKNEHALINRMGFNNPGIKTTAERLRKWGEKNKKQIPMGLNIGKGRNTPLEEATDDYLMAFDHLAPFADYVVLNISSPNTPNLRTLQKEESLKNLVMKISEKNRMMAESAGQPPTMIFTKVSPDVDDETLDNIAHVALECNLGLIATNTTIDHSGISQKHNQEGGLSGKPLRTKSNYVLKRLYTLTKGVIPLIGVGGIFSAEDAYEKIRLGASLVQVYTGWIFEGPSLVPKINKGLIKLMERDGFKRIQDAVGTLS